MKKIMFMLSVVTCLTTSSCSQDQNSDPDLAAISNEVIIEWNEIAYQAFGGETYQHSLMASRINAMTHIAMHDALNAIYPVYATYTFSGRDEKANPIAAAASAAYTVLAHEIPEKLTFLDSVLQRSLATITDGEAKSRGIQLGKGAGQAIIDARANDGSAGNPLSPVPPSNTAGVYQVVPPFDFVFAPNWVDVKPFGLLRKDQFRSSPHPSLESKEYADALSEVKAFGELNSTLRSGDQTAYTHFWYEFSEAGWNRVARVVALNQKLGLLETARLFALVDMALADAYIAGWDSKFHYNFWRPYTAIHRAAMAGDNQTSEDSQWEPEMPTPPVQDYPSTHSALGNAGATVLAGILGQYTSFSFTSPTALPGNGARNFSSFKQAADENADSRVMAGIHFRFACDAGQEMGDKVGQWILANHLKPLKHS